MLPATTNQQLPTLKTARHLPERQRAEAVTQYMRAVDMPLAMERGHQLAKALTEARPQTLHMIDSMLCHTLRFFGAMIQGEEHIDKATRLDLVDAIVDTYPNLNVEEVALVLANAKRPKPGNEGKIFGKLNAAIVMQWFSEYTQPEGERDLYWEKAHRAESLNHDTSLTAIEAVAALVSMKVGADGEISIGPLVVAEEAHEELSVEMRRARAAKREAEKWEQKEEARLREVERRRAMAEQVVATNAIQEQANKRFQEYANKHYFANLTTTEAAILKASGSGVLSAADRAHYEKLCERWQRVVADWEQVWHNEILNADKGQRAA